MVALAGPELMQIAFGKKFTYDRLGLLIVTAGMGFYLASGTLNQAALATLDFAGAWSELEPDAARLVGFVKPRDLE